MAHITWKSRVELDAEAEAQAMAALRGERDRALRESDWTQLPDAPLTGQEKAEWVQYRQSLRDLPSVAGENPAGVELPTPPGGAS